MKGRGEVQTAEEPDDAGDSADLSGELPIDDNNVSASLDKLEADGTVTLTFKNKSAKELQLGMENVQVNGFYTDSNIVRVDAGDTQTFTFPVDHIVKKILGIDKVETLRFDLKAKDLGSTGDAAVIASQTCTLYPAGDKSAEVGSPTRKDASTDWSIVDNDKIKLVVVGASRMKDNGEQRAWPYLYLYAENKTASSVTIDLNNAVIDDKKSSDASKHFIGIATVPANSAMVFTAFSSAENQEMYRKIAFDVKVRNEKYKEVFAQKGVTSGVTDLDKIYG